eukprot:scaffold2992_cov214-Amphora_coffeaeformis.AAC.2
METQDEEALKKWREKKKARERRREPDANSDDAMLHLMMNDNDDDEIITPAQKRRMEQQEIERLREKRQRGGGVENESTAATKNKDDSEGADVEGQENKDGNKEQSTEALKDDRNKEQSTETSIGDPSADNKNTIDKEEEPKKPDEERVQSLLEQAAALNKNQNLTGEDRVARQRQHEEELLLRHAQQVGGKALKNAKQVASGISYTQPMPSTWRAPRFILQQGEESWQKIRKDWHIDVEGSNIPPPITRFADMKFPLPIIKILEEKGITRPTPIQMQGIPIAISGRDMVGIAFTGSGKTLTFCLPMVMAALEEELRMSITSREGPIGVILAPSRELARQTYDQTVEFCQVIAKQPGYPSLRALLLIGGESLRDQAQIIESTGVHCIVATPGRLRGMLKQKTLNFDICRFICLDEADRLMELGFDEEVGEIFNFFKRQKQTLLFSATFPQKFQDFARQTLIQPIVVNVGRAGAANLDVIQEVEYVKQEAKIVYLLHCLQKTAPPVCVFTQRQREVDEIHEYLLLKGVEAVSLHGGKSQEERNEAISLFKDGRKDVLIATDVAAKGLDFPAIQHVINFDMPTEIENYVHRIGRTGRCGKTGVATTFINKSVDETTLLDLKGLLQEARQRIPPVLEMLEDPRDLMKGDKTAGGCSFCGGLGHSILNCPKIEKDAKKIHRGQHDALQMGGGDW